MKLASWQVMLGPDGFLLTIPTILNYEQLAKSVNKTILEGNRIEYPRNRNSKRQTDRQKEGRKE